MKKTILGLIMLSFFFVAKAQKSEIKNAKNNYTLYEVGMQTKSPMNKQLEVLDLAKKSADAAITNDKTKDDAELWVYRALIYSSIAVTDTVNKANASSSFGTAQESITKAKQLDASKENAKTIESAEAIMMQNKGVAAFNKKDFKEAYNSFKFISDIMPTDSLFSLYTAIAANGAQMYDEAAKYYGKTIELNPSNAGLYHELAIVYLTKTDTTNALKVIEEGRIKHPDFLTLIYDELIYLNRGQAAKQIIKVEDAISKIPTNKTLLFVAGIAYSAMSKSTPVDKLIKGLSESSIANLFGVPLSKNNTTVDGHKSVQWVYNNGLYLYFNEGKLESWQYDEMKPEFQKSNNSNQYLSKAEESYKKAIAIDPNYTDAIYNLAVIFINKANNYINEANLLPNNKSSETKYNELKKKFDTELSNALPLLEKARELSPKDTSTLTTLREVYVKLNKLDKAAEVKKVLDGL